MPKIQKIYVRRPVLPSEYQRVEYIQSSGTQYIDTGISANQYLSYEADFQAINTSNYYNFFGARTSSNTNRFGLMIYNSVFHMMIGNTNAFNTSVDTNRHKCSVFMNNGAFTSNIDGTEATGSPGTTVYVNQNFRLFGMDYSSSTSIGNCPMRLYSFKLYTGNSTLVRDFVPCYRKSDSVIGLYDTVNGQFYTNAGTGTFTKGADVSNLKEYQVRPKEESSEITETITLTPGNTPSIYRSGFKIESVTIEGDFYSQTGAWTGAGFRLANSSGYTAGWYIEGGENESYNNSSAKFETNQGSTTKLKSAQNYNIRGTTAHIKVIIERDKSSVQIGNNTPETYLYSSGDKGTFINSVLDDPNVVIYYYASNSYATLSTGQATITYSKV